MALGPLKVESFESAPLGNFSTLTLAEMTVSLTGTGTDANAGITNATGDAILGYNTTSGGTKHLRFVPPFGVGVVSLTFTPNVRLQAWGAYFTGVGTVPNTTVEIVFDDGSAQTFAVPGDAAGGATFFGFTDPGKLITSVTVRETLTSTSTRDILSIDDVRFTPSETTQLVPAGEAATVTVEENGKDVAGIDILDGTFNEDVIVTVRFEELEDGEACHDYLFGQIGRCLEIMVAQADGGTEPVVPAEPLIVGACVPESFGMANPALSMFEFHERDSRAVALRNVPATFLDCSGFTLSSSGSNWLRRIASGLVNGVQQLFGPKPLMAVIDLGLGGLLPAGDGISTFFTWASPIQISEAGLGVNVRNSGKDAFGVSGSFDLSAKTFAPFPGEQGFNPAGDPAANDVTVGFGKFVQSIPAASFKFKFDRFVYTPPFGTTAGIFYVEVFPDGRFRVDGAIPTEGDKLPTFRAFSLQIGHRTQGGGLECRSDRRCRLHAD